MALRSVGREAFSDRMRLGRSERKPRLDRKAEAPGLDDNLVVEDEKYEDGIFLAVENTLP